MSNFEGPVFDPNEPPTDEELAKEMAIELELVERGLNPSQAAQRRLATRERVQEVLETVRRDLEEYEP